METTLAPYPASGSMITRDIAEIRSYHAHVYYAVDEADRAGALREQIARQFGEPFGLYMSALSGRPVGPHPVPMFRVDFPVSLFDSFVPWLMLNRADLSVLVHPNTDDAVADHLDQPLWLGSQQVLRMRGMTAG